MEGKLYFVLAQVLGVFPVNGVWNSDSAKSFSYRKLSLPFIYSLLALVLRILTMMFELLLLLFWCMENIHSLTDKATAFIGLGGTFSSGAVYQILILTRLKKFLKLLKKFHEFDMAYERDNNATRKCSLFMTSNVVFTLFTIIFCLSMIGTYLLTPTRGASAVSGINKHLDAIMGSNYPLILIMICVLIAVFMESGTLFPIYQLEYAIKNLEVRLQATCNAITEYSNPKPKSEIEMLLDIYTGNGNWAEKRAFAKKAGVLQRNSGNNQQKSQFWNCLCRRYLDFQELFQTFLTFAGSYFIIIYPMQILSSVGVLYLNTTNNVFHDAPFVEISLNVIASLGIIRVLGMSSIGCRIEGLHNQMLMRTLRVDSDTILDEDERNKYEKFVSLVKTVSFELSAGGVFSVSKRNIPAIITAVVSYIIILFQFKSSEKTTETPNCSP